MILYFILSFSLISAKSSEDEKKRESVVAVWRHGRRSPMVFLPKLNDSLDMWPDGTRQLTARGIEDHKRLGKFIRNNYNDLISNEFSRDEIYIRSTDFDRTIQSAEANMQGLFGEISKPIPIHTIPVKDDNLLRFPVRGCSKYDRIKDELRNTSAMKKLNKKFQKELQALKVASQNATNIDELRLTDEIVDDIKDSIECHLDNDKPLNKTIFTSGCDDCDFESLHHKWRYLSAKRMESLFTDLEHDRRIEVSRLNGGLLLGHILEYLKNPYIHPETGHKVNFFGYSAHETTIAALSIAMDVWEDVPPFYASAFFFEKYNDGTVKIFFHNSTRNDFDNSTQNHFDITTNVCRYAKDQTRCTLDELETSLMEVIPANWDVECENEHATIDKYKGRYIAVLVIMLLSWLVIIGLFMYSRRVPIKHAIFN